MTGEDLARTALALIFACFLLVEELDEESGDGRDQSAIVWGAARASGLGRGVGSAEPHLCQLGDRGRLHPSLVGWPGRSRRAPSSVPGRKAGPPPISLLHLPHLSLAAPPSLLAVASGAAGRGGAHPCGPESLRYQLTDLRRL